MYPSNLYLIFFLMYASHDTDSVKLKHKLMYYGNATVVSINKKKQNPTKASDETNLSYRAKQTSQDTRRPTSAVSDPLNATEYRVTEELHSR